MTPNRMRAAGRIFRRIQLTRALNPNCHACQSFDSAAADCSVKEAKEGRSLSLSHSDVLLSSQIRAVLLLGAFVSRALSGGIYQRTFRSLISL